MAKKKNLLEIVRQLVEEKKYLEVLDLVPEEVLEKEKSAELYAWKSWACSRLKYHGEAMMLAEKALGLDNLLPHIGTS